MQHTSGVFLSVVDIIERFDNRKKNVYVCDSEERGGDICLNKCTTYSVEPLLSISSNEAVKFIYHI